jgi:hypothetical protein
MCYAVVGLKMELLGCLKLAGHCPNILSGEKKEKYFSHV